MRDIQDGDLLALLNCSEAFDELVAIGKVKSRDRLIAKQETRPGRQRACEPHPLSLSARKGRRPPIAQVFHPAECGNFGQAGQAFGASLSLKAKADVGRDVEVRKQQVVLKDEPDPASAERFVNPPSRVKQD
jgi:hypothetical protein